jgi:hypothetical protein
MGYMGPYDGADYNLTLSHSRLLSPEAVFNEKHGVWDPMSELTITHLI